MTRREIMARVAGLVATLLPLAPAQVRDQAADQPVVTEAPARARLELVAPGS